MAVIVRPTITIDGIPVACHADALDTEPVAVSGLEIQWGRDDYQSSSVSPSSARLELIDTSGEWASRIRQAEALGRKVQITWIGESVAADAPDAEPEIIGPVVMFRGRIMAAEAMPSHIVASDGRRGWLITLELADRTADYGNGFSGDQEWSRGSMIHRANQIKAIGLEAGAEIDAVYFWPGYTQSRARPMEVHGKSALTLLGEFYESMGNDTYAYDPDENVIRQFIRLSQPMTTYLGSFDSSLGAVLPVPNDIVVDERTYPGVALGGCRLLGEPRIVADPETDINRLECKWQDQGTNWGDWTTVMEDVRPGDARRVMAWDSWLDDGAAIDPTLANVWDRAREEGRRPRHPMITTPSSHEFVTERLARWILQTWANTRPAYIAGSLPYLWLMADEPDYSPIVAPIGGITRFDPVAGWSVDLHVHWIHNNGPAITPASWASLQQIKTTTEQPDYPWWYPILGIPIPPPVTVGSPIPERDLVWGDPATNPGYGWDTSLTWSDTRHIERTKTEIKDVLR